jgi:two-component system nitrogen regulation response regulator NtrX
MRSESMRRLHQMLQVIAPKDVTVTLVGESGTGKEVLARRLHDLSGRHAQPFIPINCAAIPEGLIESELFGHTKGAFTGADQMKRGKFDLADGGTIFLDEIGDMSLTAQAKVLRILQEKKFERVGGAETIPSDVRVIAATNKDLKLELQAGRFRTDLYHRLNLVPFHLPPLRERKEDIPELADHFLRIFNAIH